MSQLWDLGTRLLITFLKDIDNDLYKRYTIDRYKGPSTSHVAEPTFEFKPVTFVDKPLRYLKSFDKLKEPSCVSDYGNKERYQMFYSKLYLVPKFYSYVNELIPNKFPKIDNDHPRMLIPFFDEKIKCLYFVN